MDQHVDNPFDLTKASDYSDRQVKDFWVDMVGGQNSLVNFIKPKSKVPMLLLGGKGSGKTHLMRYCSSTVQELRFPSLREAIISEEYVGIYTNADGLNVLRFSGKGQSEEAWEAVFAYSFELWLAGTFLESLRPALAAVELEDDQWQRNFACSAAEMFSSNVRENIDSYDTFLAYLARCRRSVDLIVNQCAITRSLDGVDINFNPGALIFGLPKLIASLCDFASSSLFLYLIDEIENFTPQQQRFLNTLIRYRRDNATFRIGARLYGIKTYETLGSGEPIKRDAEFEATYLDAMLREDQAKYEELAVNLIVKRLAAAGFKLKVDENIAAYFEEVSSENYFEKTVLEITNGRDESGKERPHIQRFRKAAEKIIGDKTIVDCLVSNLSYPQNPLLEKTNLLIFYKKLSKKVDALKLAEGIKNDVRNLVASGPSAAPEYYDTYSHFSSDLLAQLARDYGRKPPYAGLRTLIRISQGVPRNLLSLLKHIYRRSVFLGEVPFAQSSISIDAQMQGVNDAAAWFWEDAQPDSHGTLVRGAVENLAMLLRSIRYSDNPAECDICSFKVNLSEVAETANHILKMAENWSFVLQVNGSSSAKNDDRVLTQYQINPMLAARWGISESRRGVLELRSAMVEVLVSVNDMAEVQREINTRIDGMNLPKLLEQRIRTAREENQSGLFDDD